MYAVFLCCLSLLISVGLSQIDMIFIFASRMVVRVSVTLDANLPRLCGAHPLRPLLLLETRRRRLTLIPWSPLL
jgi:hypothetical protein